MAEGRVERRLAAILAADVVGYPRLMEADEEGTLAALRAIRREVGGPHIAEHRGRIFKTTGDGLLVEFASVVDAVRCAAEIQRAMADRNVALPGEHSVELRIGVHQGDIIVEDGDISVTGSTPRPGSKPWRSQVASVYPRGCRRTPPASSTWPSTTSPSTA
jgi:adenylate cyclase